MARQQLVASELWQDGLGKHNLARLSSLMALQQHLSRDEQRVAVKNVAWSMLVGDEQQSLYYYMGEEIATSSSCIYGAALEILQVLSDKFDLNVFEDSRTILDVSLLLHEWAVRRGDIHQAQALMLSIQSHAPPKDARVDVAIQWLGIPPGPGDPRRRDGGLPRRA